MIFRDAHRTSISRTLTSDGAADERRTTTLLALFVLAALLIPQPSGAQIQRPTAEQDSAAGAQAEPDPAPTAEALTPPAAEPVVPADLMPDEDEAPAEEAPADEAPADEAPADEQAGEGSDGAPAEQAEGSSGEADVPMPPGQQEPSAVQAEGDGAEEVVAAPQVPEGQEAQARPGEAAAAGDPATSEGEATTTLEPAPVTVTYGVSTVPSLGSTVRPLTTDGLADPMVLVPMVAGAEQASAAGQAVAQASTLQALTTPIRGVAAGGLGGMQPSAAATAAAALMVVVAAAYGAVLRQRGEDVPEVIRLTDAIRPVDRHATAVRSVRPTDLGPTARSVRP